MTKQAKITNKDNTVRRYESRAAVFKALAHATRIRIIHALAERERCVCDLVELVGEEQ
jgi:DNA-binding transcriptional ArsR family regulator